jgi:XTP/dITP diphosphohydrolase
LPAGDPESAAAFMETIEVELVLASRNAHKLRELGAMIAPHRLEALPPEVELPPEHGATFEENAVAKALAAGAGTGRAALADDSGIAVAALGGAPGIHSARFAGESATDEQNLAKLLHELEGERERRAAYVCVLALVEPNRTPKVFEGRCEGRLVERPRGTAGFGYDPIFVADDSPGGRPRTMAELSPAEKDAISHRGRAARKLLEWLESRS